MDGGVTWAGVYYMRIASFLKKVWWRSTTAAWNEELKSGTYSNILPFLCIEDLSGASLRAVSTGEGN